MKGGGNSDARHSDLDFNLEEMKDEKDGVTGMWGMLLSARFKEEMTLGTILE